jgi:molybdate transport system regulatory protein
MANPSVRLRIDFGPGRSLGPGKISLLEEMQRTGSLSKAASVLGMSYRRAWVLVQSMNALFDEPLARMTKGGRGGGGGAQITARGRETVTAFRRAERQATLAVARTFRDFQTTNDELPRQATVKRISRTT